MKFYDRKVELEILKQNREQSTKKASFTVMVGRRRIGKTSLILKSVEGQKYLYLFVSRKSEHLLCAQFQEDAERALGLTIFGKMTHFPDLFKQLLNFAVQEHYTLIIDEFQEFEYVNPAIYGDIQNLWDRYKNTAKINFIVCGSIYSLMMKIFENRKEPLFGRLTSKLILKPFSVNVVKEILLDHHPTCRPEDLLCLYLLTGGVVKYIELFMDSGAVRKKEMLDRVTRADSPFLGEGKDLLISEFGKEYGTYFSILQLIASGKNKQSEIDSIIDKNTGAYLANLEKEYSLIVKSRPMFSKPGSRNIKWALTDNYLLFWFRFVYPNQALIEIGRYELLKEYMDRNYQKYSGLILEKYFREKIAESERVTQVGSYWDNKGLNEIDIVALNDLDKTAIVAEVKLNPKKINKKIFEQKVESIQKELAPYKVELRTLSIEDM